MRDYPPGVVEPREIAKGIFMQDRQHWAMNSFAGEGLTVVNGDRSGCVIKDGWKGLDVVLVPKVAIYRHYWSTKGKISCFLSYPNGMGYHNGYFWEVYCLEGGLFEDVERFSTEKELEKRIIKLLIEGAKK